MSGKFDSDCSNRLQGKREIKLWLFVSRKRLFSRSKEKTNSWIYKRCEEIIDKCWKTRLNYQFVVLKMVYQLNKGRRLRMVSVTIVLKWECLKQILKRSQFDRNLWMLSMFSFISCCFPLEILNMYCHIHFYMYSILLFWIAMKYTDKKKHRNQAQLYTLLYFITLGEHFKSRGESLHGSRRKKTLYANL